MDAQTSRTIFIPIFLVLLQSLLTTSQFNRVSKADNVVAEMQVVCHSDSIVLKVNTNTPFNGMIYSKEASSTDNCVTKYHLATNMTYRLPLKSCGTSSNEVDDGIEYYNTVVVQPHMRLMTNQGKGYHIRCKYQTRERTIANTHFNVSAAFLMQNGPQGPTTPLLATAAMPSCTMKIFRSGRDDVAETVKIGDKLIMVIEIDQQDMYGMKITNCVVRDGMNTAEQQLINDLGCPVDESVMPKFDYTNNFTRAAVVFPAHKFPHTSSVYYQCNVRLCINNGGCEQTICANSSSNVTSQNQNNLIGGVGASGGPRRKRFVAHNQEHNQQTAVMTPLNGQNQDSNQMANSEAPLIQAPMLPSPDELKSAHSKDGSPRDMSFDVYSGLYVNDIDVGAASSSDSFSRQNLLARSGSSLNESSNQSTEQLCLTAGKAGLMVVLASLTSVGLVLMIICQVGWGGSSSNNASIIERHHNQHSADISGRHYVTSQNHYLEPSRRQSRDNRHQIMGAIYN